MKYRNTCAEQPLEIIKPTNLLRLTGRVAASHPPVTSVGKRKNAVRASAEDERAIQATPTLLSVPGTHEAINDSMDEGIGAGVSRKTDRTVGA